MSTDFNTPSNNPSAGQQRRQANRLLLRLQWLLILLLIIALSWLYISQQRFQHQVNDRLQSNEQVVTRLNEMDDRLFAISQQTPPPENTAVGSQAQNQMDLLRIQIQAADRLLADNNYTAAIDLLRGLQWQLSQSSNEIAPALTIVIKQSLNKDIERLQAQSSQPSPWQLQNLAIQNIQTFLHSHERMDGAERAGGATTRQSNNEVAMTRRQLTLHEVIMTLNLAMQASNMREKDQLTSYLYQARNQLQTLTAPINSTANPDKKTTTDDTARTKAASNAESSKVKNGTTETDSDVTIQRPSKQNTLATMNTPKDIKEVLLWLDKLIATAPTPTPLLTTQILDQPKR